MTSVAIGIIVFLLMIILVVLGCPVFVSILGCSMLGFYLVGGPTVLAQQMRSGILAVNASYSFAVIPLFMLVGSLAGKTGVAKKTFVACKVWLGRFRGGMLYTLVCANAIFGACSGVSQAGTVIFSQIASPEMNRMGYNQKITLGCIASSSSLAVLIPPSVGIMTLCLLADISIGTGLVCGFCAGILLVVVMCVLIKIIVTVKPQLVPEVTEEDKNVTWSERLKSLKLLVPVAVLFMLVVGGSMLGWFPATVGGAIASTALLIYAICIKVPFKEIMGALRESAQTFAGLYLIIFSGTIFSRFITMTGLAKAIISLIASANVAPFLVFTMVVIFYILCGCVMNCMSIIVITIPLIFPLLTSLGYNGFVVCVLLILLAELGAMTPPFGLNVFTVANVLRVKPSIIFSGGMPFLITYIVVVFLGILFPKLILWLPMLLGANVG